MTTNDRAKEVIDFKEKIKKQAEELIVKKFPQNILEFHELLESEKFCVPSLSKIYSDINIPIPRPSDYNHKGVGDGSSKKRKFDDLDDGVVMGTKVFVLPNGVAPCNHVLVDLIDIVKPKIKQLVEDTNLLKMWILFLIPRIEDGNNFGVSIQEETLGEIRTVESEAAAYFDQLSRYFMSRGKIVAKVAKYPHVEDFRRTLQEIDEKEYLSIRLVVAELRNHYATLHDMIHKNLDKIKKPRSSNADTMY